MDENGGTALAKESDGVAAGTNMQESGSSDAGSSALFPPRRERISHDADLTRALAVALDEVRAGAVTPTYDPAAFRLQLAGFDFETETDLDAVVAWTISGLRDGLVHMSHPRYFGLFNPSPAFPALVADRIAAAFNPQLASATTSPAAVAIEAHVIAAMAARAGMSAGSGGHFTSGGSEANGTALICALNEADPRFGEEGVRSFAGAPTFYVSRESHGAWLKLARSAGLGRIAARQVATDGMGRMDPEALAGMIEADRAEGQIPVMIAATAGTTNAGMIDPLGPIARIARDNGLWFHVDAAWAGALVVSDRLRGALAGIELADSATIDAHKWLATTMGCGMFLTQRPQTLAAAFHVAATYMPPNAVGLDPYVTTIQWSRRFLGLRLFMNLAAAGWRGYATHVERAVDLAARIGSALGTRGWRVANASPAAVLCLEPPIGRSPRRIVDRVVASGRAWVSVAIFEGREVVRVCITHGETGEEDAAALIDALADAANQT